MHFDIDLRIYFTPSLRRKEPHVFEEQHKLYRKPFEVLSLADFSHYYEMNGSPDYENFQR
jgi:hypothetical protein